MNEKEIGRLLQWDADHILHPVFPARQNAGLIVESAEGVVLRDVRGKEYIDTGSQLTCVNLCYGQQ